jgi:hypothetical protein
VTFDHSAIQTGLEANGNYLSYIKAKARTSASCTA